MNASPELEVACGRERPQSHSRQPRSRPGRGPETATLHAKQPYVGPIWYRWPDIEPLRAHPRFPEVIAIMHA
jgi:hypothetical protein